MLCGIGIFIGRFLRWNSWDVFTQYRGVYRDVAAAGSDPLGHPVAVSVSLMFSAILFVCYLTFYNSSAVDVGAAKPRRRRAKT